MITVERTSSEVQVKPAHDRLKPAIDIRAALPDTAKVEVVHYHSGMRNETEPIVPGGRTVTQIAGELPEDALGLRIKEAGQTKPVTVFTRAVWVRSSSDLGMPFSELAQRPEGSTDQSNKRFEPLVLQRVGGRDVLHHATAGDIVLFPTPKTAGPRT